MRHVPSLPFAASLVATVVFSTPVAIAAPAIASQRTVNTVAGPITEAKLANGLTVILKENRAAPIVTFTVTYKVGSRNENTGATGAAHLLEHMLFKGTKTLGKGQIAQLLDRNGANNNATTGIDRTNYYETYSSDRLELGLTVEAARMRDALILDSERQSEMTVVRNELERGESNPERMIYQHLMSQAYRSHPYHHPTIGWRSDIERQPTSVLKAFYDTYYQPNNAVIALVGDFQTQEALTLINRYFGAIPVGKPVPSVHTVEEQQTGERRFILRRRGETNLVQMGFHIPAASHPDMGPFHVLDAVLSNGVTGRLYQAIVEKQIASAAWSDVGVTKDPGLFRMGATLKPGGKHAEVEAALLAELSRLVTEPITPEELQKAKDQAEASYVYANEGTAGLAKGLGQWAAIATWERNFSLLSEIKATTSADLLRLAKTYFSPENRTVGWYVSTPDGPVFASGGNVGGGKATANTGKVIPAKPFPFEQRKVTVRTTTQPVRQVLTNGLTVLVLPNPSSRTVAIDGQIWAGALHQADSHEQVASAVAAMLNKGTEKRDKLKFASDLERISAGVDFSAGYRTTNMAGQCLDKDFDTTVTALAEALRSPTFPDGELVKIKTEWKADLQRSQDSPGTHAGRLFAQAVYPPHHPFYERGLDADMQAVEALDRDKLKAFHRRYYGPNTTTLVVVGNITPAHAIRSLEAAFAGWQPATKHIPALGMLETTAPKRHSHAMPDKSNVLLEMGHVTTLERKSPDYYAARLANYILGGSTLTGRLGLRVRDELGLTYGINSNLSGGTGPGVFSVTMTTNPANLATGEREIRTLLNQFLKTGVTAQELAYAKSTYIGAQATSLGTNGAMASSLAGIELYGLGLDFWGRYPAIIDGITLEQVNAAARRYIHPERLQTVIVGPIQ